MEKEEGGIKNRSTVGKQRRSIPNLSPDKFTSFLQKCFDLAKSTTITGYFHGIKLHLLSIDMGRLDRYLVPGVWNIEKRQCRQRFRDVNE